MISVWFEHHLDKYLDKHLNKRYLKISVDLPRCNFAIVDSFHRSLQKNRQNNILEKSWFRLLLILSAWKGLLLTKLWLDFGANLRRKVWKVSRFEKSALRDAKMLKLYNLWNLIWFSAVWFGFWCSKVLNLWNLIWFSLMVRPLQCPQGRLHKRHLAHLKGKQNKKRASFISVFSLTP